MTSNQDLADSLIRQRVYLLGYSKQLAEEVVVYLRETEPEIRELILKLFGAGAHRVITRLRDAEVRLRQIRSAAWKRALEYITLRLLEMGEKHQAWYRKALPAKTEPVNKDRFPTLVATALLAGNTLKEVFATLERADTDRAVAQLRMAYLSKDESDTKAIRRITGSTSYVAVSATNAVRTVSATAVIVIANVVQRAVVAANSGLFDTEVWISILDLSTTQGCVKLHMRKFPVGVGQQPGYHWHCRSDRVPYIDGGGPIVADTYTKWLLRQPDDFQKYAGKEFAYAKLRPMKLTQIYKDRSG